MSQIKKISENKNFTAVNVGKLNNLTDHAIPLPNGEKIEGKLFLKDITNATGSEISYNILPPHAESPFFHAHKKNEETYLILKGSGLFQVDEECFEITEGSVVRVSTAGKRAVKNNTDQHLIYIVIQVKENSLEEYTMADGLISEHTAKWN